MRSVSGSGASSGFGAATARRFVESRDRVVTAARRADSLHTLSDELGTNLLLPPELDVRVRIRLGQNQLGEDFR